MTRREALYSVSLMLGGSIVGSQVFLQGCGAPSEAAQSEEVTQVGILTDAQVALLDEIGDSIIPSTSDSGGAKAAGIGAFMQVIVTDCYSTEEQQVFQKGLQTLEETVQSVHQSSFQALDAAQRKDILLQIQAEAQEYDLTIEAENERRRADSTLDPVPPHYFTMIKQLTIWGYFTSEIGMTQALRYVEVPGRYDGCMAYAPGDKAWAPK